MTFFKDLDTIMKQDFGNRGLLKALPDNPIRETLETLSTARRVILLTGFPVRLEDGTYVGETDGPLGIADIAAALTALGVSVLVITDEPAFSNRERRRLLPRTQSKTHDAAKNRHRRLHPKLHQKLLPDPLHLLRTPRKSRQWPLSQHAR